MSDGPSFFDPGDPSVAALAAMYEHYMVPAVFGPWAEALVDEVGVGPGERVLDVACGTGAVTRVLVERVGPTGSVVGVDLSPVMLGIAAELDLPHVELRTGDAMNLPVDDASFDVAVCQQGLQFVPDRGAAAAEMHRALVDGGRVAVACWRSIEDQPFFQHFDAAVEEMGLGASAPPNVPLSFGDADALRSVLEGAGFTDVEVRRQERMALWPDFATYAKAFVSVPPFSAILAGAPSEVSQRFVDAFVRRVEVHRTDRGHEIPWSANVATATKRR